MAKHPNMTKTIRKLSSTIRAELQDRAGGVARRFVWQLSLILVAWVVFVLRDAELGDQHHDSAPQGIANEQALFDRMTGNDETGRAFTHAFINGEALSALKRIKANEEAKMRELVFRNNAEQHDEGDWTPSWVFQKIDRIKHRALRIPYIGFLLYSILDGFRSMPPYVDESIFEHHREWLREGDIIISAQPKAGATWMMFTIMKMIELNSTQHPHGHRKSLRMPPRQYSKGRDRGGVNDGYDQHDAPNSCGRTIVKINVQADPSYDGSLNETEMHHGGRYHFRLQTPTAEAKDVTSSGELHSSASQDAHHDGSESIRDIYEHVRWADFIYYPGQPMSERIRILSQAPLRVFKTHTSPPRLPVFPDGKTKYVVLTRKCDKALESMRDFMQSHSKQFCRLWGDLPIRLPIPNRIWDTVKSQGIVRRLMCDNFAANWEPHLQQSKLFSNRVTNVRYEDRIRDDLAVLRHLASFLELDLDESDIAHLAHEVSFGQMKQRSHVFRLNHILDPFKKQGKLDPNLQVFDETGKGIVNKGPKR